MGFGAVCPNHFLSSNTMNLLHSLVYDQIILSIDIPISLSCILRAFANILN